MQRKRQELFKESLTLTWTMRPKPKHLSIGSSSGQLFSTKRLANSLRNTKMESKDFYTAQDLADKLGVNIMTIYRYIKAGRLKAYKIGKEFRIERLEFKRLLKRSSTK